MALLVRTLLVWLLVLAVPAQGVAAATMAFCGPGHHGGTAAAAAHQTGSAEHANHRSDGAHEVASEAAGSSAPGLDSHVVQKKCSACAACCSISALLSPGLAVPAPTDTPTAISARAPTIAAFAADGPDRPPRNVRA